MLLLMTIFLYSSHFLGLISGQKKYFLIFAHRRFYWPNCLWIATDSYRTMLQLHTGAHKTHNETCIAIESITLHKLNHVSSERWILDSKNLKRVNQSHCIDTKGWRISIKHRRTKRKSKTKTNKIEHKKKSQQ